MIYFDESTARDILDALRLLEGRLLGTPRRLSPGSRELRSIAERSAAASGDQRRAPAVTDLEDGAVHNLLTIDEASSWLHVSVSTVRRLIRNGELTPSRIGRSVRIRSSVIEDYLDAHQSGSRRAA